MGNYLRNVARRTVDTSLLRPRIASRFEPVSGMGPTINQFREVTAERVVEAPLVRQATEARVPPVPHVAAAQPHCQESRVEKPAAVPQTPVQDLRQSAEHIVEQKAGDIPVKKNQTDVPRIPAEPVVTRVRTESHEQTAETLVPAPREVIREIVSPQREITETIIRIESTKSEAPARSELPQFPTPKSARPELRPEVTKVVPQIRRQESPSPVALHADIDQPRIETSTPTVHVTIGKLTVQATLPAAHAPAPPRAAAPAAPRLTLETYLSRRGGRP